MNIQEKIEEVNKGAEEDAKFMVERLKVIQELKKFSRPFVVDEYNYELSYNNKYNEFIALNKREVQTSSYYFASQEEVQAAIDKIGEDRLKKYYFMIEEGDEE